MLNLVAPLQGGLSHVGSLTFLVLQVCWPPRRGLMFAAARVLQVCGTSFPVHFLVGGSFTIKVVNSDLFGPGTATFMGDNLAFGPEWIFPPSQASGWNFSAFDLSDEVTLHHTLLS